MEPKSGVLWLKIGDNNTKFFHCQATQKHKKKNYFREIMDEFNTWRTQPQDIAASLISDYQDSFSTSNLDPHWPSLDQIPLVTKEMNSILIATFQVCEVKEALKQMAPLKASSFDGMFPLFCQHFWGVVEDDVKTSVLSWLNLGTIPHSLNHTFVTVIPKTKNLEFVRDNRPISLCNVLNKIF